MEGGQKVNIDLESGLDVHSSDMLVPLQQPKFQHNRQKFQGKYLPTSVRFEHDGWAVDHDVYEFIFDDFELPIGTSGDMYVTRFIVNNNPLYLLSIIKKDTDKSTILAKIWYNFVSPYTGVGFIITHDYVNNCNNVTLSVGNKEVSFIVPFNDLTQIGQISDDLCDVDLLSISGGKLKYSVTDKGNKVVFNFSFSKIKDLYLSDNTLFANFLSLKEGTFNFEGNYHSVIYSENNSFLSITTNGVTTDVSKSSDTYNFEYTPKIALEYNNESIIPKLSDFNLIQDTTIIKSDTIQENNNTVSSKDLSINKWQIYNDNDFDVMTPDSNRQFAYSGYLPVWVGLTVETYVDTKKISFVRDILFNLDSPYGDEFHENDYPAIWENSGIYIPLAIRLRTDGSTISKHAVSRGMSANLWFHNKLIASKQVIDYSAPEIMPKFKFNYYKDADRNKKNNSSEYFDLFYGNLYIENYIPGSDDYDEEYTYEIRKGWINTGFVYRDEDDDEDTDFYLPKHGDGYVLGHDKVTYLKSVWINKTTTVDYAQLESESLDGLVLSELNVLSSNPYSALNNQTIEFVQTYNPTIKSGYLGTYDKNTGKVMSWDTSGNVQYLSLADLCVWDTFIRGSSNDSSLNINFSVSEQPLFSNFNTNILANDFKSNMSISGVSFDSCFSGIVPDPDMLCAQQAVDNVTINAYNDSVYSARARVVLKRSVRTRCIKGYFTAGFELKENTFINSGLDSLSTYDITDAPDNNYIVYIDRDIDTVNNKNILSYNIVSPVLFAKEVDSSNNLKLYYFLKSSSYFYYTMDQKLNKYSYDYDVSDTDTDIKCYIPGNIWYNSSNYKSSAVCMRAIQSASYNESTLKFTISAKALSTDIISDFSVSHQGILTYSDNDTFAKYNDYINYNKEDSLFKVIPSEYRNILTNKTDDVKLLFFPEGTTNVDTANVLTIRRTYKETEEAITYTDVLIPENVDSLDLESSTTNELVFKKPIIYTFSDILSNLLPTSNITESVYLSSITGNLYTISDNEKTASFNLDTLKLTYAEQEFSFYYDVDTDKYTVDVESYLKAIYDLLLQGVVKSTASIKVTDVTNDSIVFNYNDTDFTIDTSDTTGIRRKDKNSSLTAKCIDVNTSDLLKKEVLVQNTESEYQFLKQKWNTTNDIENYWWLDSEHILSLTKDSLILSTKTDEVDDWSGDKFIDTYLYSRHDLLQNAIKYGCTSAKNGCAAFWYITDVTENKCTIHFRRITEDTDELKISITLVKKNLGEAFSSSNNCIETYSDVTMKSIIYDSKFSATLINSSELIFGIHYDNNYNQWALYTGDFSSSVSIIQGYGFVGVDGSLTGGEIPSKYYTLDGTIGHISEAVHPLSELSSDEEDCESINDFLSLNNQGIYGNDYKQYYITDSISSIISHITYSNKSFATVELPLNNNFISSYGSASFATRSLTDYFPFISDPADIIKKSDSSTANKVRSLFKVFFKLAGSPMIYGISPKYNTAIYLQQTAGQYAYVHYNSSDSYVSKKESNFEDNNNSTFDEYTDEYTSTVPNTISSDELSFNSHTLTQEGTIDSDPFDTLLGVVALASTSAVDFLSGEINNFRANRHLSPASKVGQCISQSVANSIDSVLVTDMNVQGATPSATSKISSLITLDMFYSTSDKQQVQAGPGFVNHNFVAQCVAASSTNTHFILNQLAFTLIFTPLTMYQLEIEMKAAQFAKEYVYKGAEVVANFFTTVFGSGSNIGAAIGTAAMTVIKLTYDTLLKSLETFYDLAPSFLSAIGGDKLRVSVPNTIFKHNYDIEPKHKYGSRSECFMWPCFDIPSNTYIIDESVEPVITDKEWKLKVPQFNSSNIVPGASKAKTILKSNSVQFITDDTSDSAKYDWNGYVKYLISKIKSKQSKKLLPNDMAFVIGAESFLPLTPARAPDIGESDPVFTTAPFQDYIIDKDWQLGRTASVGMTTWVSCKDTKIIDGEPSNIVISDDFCGVAAPYTAIEVKKGLQKRYCRPWAITPKVLALNNTGYNAFFEKKAYHAFDGYGYRLVNWVGTPGMNKSHQTWQYSFIVNDRFKRSNKLPQNEFLGNFKSDPTIALTTTGEDKVFNLVTQPGEGKGLTAGTIGEDKDVRRYALPVFSEFVSTLPSAVKTITTMTLSVIDGITSLTTDNRDLQSAYKSPTSVDFTIGKNRYRYTQEYICALNVSHGITTTEELVPCLGLTFIGATPYEAYLYSFETRQYYVFTGGTSLRMVDMIERFRDVKYGRYDFVNQEVVMPCVATFLRLDSSVLDDDETDNVIVPRLKDNNFIGEVTPPLDTIYHSNNTVWFRTLSLPAGITYQGPNRCIINRFIIQDYMIDQIKSNYGKWERVPREVYHPFRTYTDKFINVETTVDTEVEGWTHNPFLLVTAPLGISESVDCMFEWEITFAWPIEMDKLYDVDSYATINIQAETMTPGGKVVAARPVHVYLTKELFTRSGNYGYYSFRYQSKNGTGNRERLHIWSDQYIAISNLQCEYKPITQKRTEALTQQVDIQKLTEI